MLYKPDLNVAEAINMCHIAEHLQKQLQKVGAPDESINYAKQAMFNFSEDLNLNS